MKPMVSMLAAGVATLAASWTLAAGWEDVESAAASFDLPAARQAALEVVAEHSQSAAAVAAAGWWWHQMNNLADPEEILSVASTPRDPELGFVLARIEAELDGRPPAGTIGTAELVGPFGVFETLDLERGRAPLLGELPPPGSRFVDAWTPVRLALTPLDGRVAPPRTFSSRGLWVVLWTVDLDRALDGWMVLEGDGSFDLSFDGTPVDRCRVCGIRDAGIGWYRVHLAAGRHQVRADLSARGRPGLRLSFIGEDGMPATLPVSADLGSGEPSASKAVRSEPPAAAELAESLARQPAEDELLLAANLSELRRDPSRQRRFVERAAEIAPDSPWPRLAMGRYWLMAATLDDAETIQRRAREELRLAEDIPAARLYERALAVREQRDEDEKRILDALVTEHPDDVRVTRLWIREALARGWVREAEDGLRRLRQALPGSREVAAAELEVLEVLERWTERERLLLTLAATEPADREIIDDLAEGCHVDEAVAVVERLRSRVVDPDLDVEFARLLFTAGRLDEASALVDELRESWGSLQAIDELALAITAGDLQANNRVLEATLARAPSALELLSLAWKRGQTPFFEPFQLSLDEVMSRARQPAEDVDAVLLLDQAVERVFRDGSSLYYYHGVTKARTPVGARQAGRLQQLPNSFRLKVRIIKPDGSVVVPATLGGGVLDEVEPGDVVDEEYLTRVAPSAASLRGHLPPYIYRFADSERAFGLSEYLLLVPPDIDIHVEGNFDGIERSEWDEGGLRAIRWRAESVPPITEERFAPPTSELLPWVSYGFGVTWQGVGDALRDRLLPLLATSPELQRWSAPLLAKDDPEQAVSAFVQALIDEVDSDRHALDFSVTAAAAFSRRAGNRLGIVAAVLLDAGWDVDLVMSRTRPFAGTHLLVPTFDSFTLPLLRVTRDGVVVWVDPEEERRGIGRIDAMLQGSDGLLIPLAQVTDEVRIIDELPTFPNPDLEEKIRVKAVVNEAGDADVTVTLPIRGPQAERVIEQIDSVPTERVPLVYQQMATSFVPAAENVHGKLERVAGGVVLELDLRARGVCPREGEEMVCRSLVFAKPLAPVLASLPVRRFDLILPVPVLQLNELTITPPNGWDVVQRPRIIETRWGSVQEEIDNDGRHHRSRLRLELPAQTVVPGDYPSFARFCHAVDELVSRPPILRRIESTGNSAS